MYFVYILRSRKDQSFYIGYTRDIKRRFSSHNKGHSLATKHKRPWRLIYFEGFVDKKDAKSREKYLKSGWGRRTIRKLLKNYLA